MWRKAPKFILTLTSLSPVLGAVAINRFEQNKHWLPTTLCLLGMVSLCFVCWGMMKLASNKGQKYKLYIKEFDRRDQGILTFLFIYLLPFLQAPDSLFAAGWLTIIYIFGIIILVIIDVGAYNFNPVMRLWGYRFYVVKDSDDVHHLLITKTVLRKPRIEIQTRRITHDVYIHTEESDAE